MKLLLRGLRWFVMVAAFVFVAIQVMRPEKVNSPVDEARAIEAHLKLTPEVETIFERSCNDCHSQKTDWPWYSNVAPVSWFVVDHVNHGRRHLDFSDWARYDREDADQMLEAICQLTKHGSMPMSSYTLMHRDAKLSIEDVQTLCGWSEAERTRLASKGTSPRASHTFADEVNLQP
ncbi:MAG TPA: heme-binding domain-containing protein [Pyrinomonadaceae bacterium]|jgi:hypothetical protein